MDYEEECALLEYELRDFLRECWPGHLVWIEPSSGSTFGVGDALVGVGSKWVNIELKIGRRKRNGNLAAKINPSQVRFHLKSYGWGLPSLFVVGLVEGGFKHLYCIEGKECKTLRDGLKPFQPICKVPQWKKFRGSSADYLVEEITRVLSDEAKIE